MDMRDGFSAKGMCRVDFYRQALCYPSRILSLTPMMTAPSPAIFTQSKPEAMQALLTPAPTEKNAYIENRLNVNRALRGSGIPTDEDQLKLLAERIFDRSFHPEGTARQMMAILSNGDVTPLLKGIKAPTLVIHGSDDPLVPMEGGKEIAEAIPNAKIKIVEGWGHSFPTPIWPILLDAITSHTSSNS